MFSPTIKLQSLDNSSIFESPQPRSPQHSPKVAVYRKKVSSDVAMKDYFSTKMQLRKEMTQCRSPQHYSEENPLSFSQGPQSPTSQSPTSPSQNRDKIKQIYLPSVKEMREFTPISPKLRVSKSPSPSVRHNTLAILQEDLRMASQRKNLAMQTSMDFYKSDKKSVGSPKNSVVVESPKMSQTQPKFNMTATNKYSPYLTFMKESTTGSPIKNRRKKMLSMSAFQFYKMAPSVGL